MFHTSNHHPTTAADGLRTYGLSGIELGHRAGERNLASARGQQHRQVQGRSRVDSIRQWLGDTMIRAGIGLAGEAARPVGRPVIQPKATMP